MCRYFFFSGCLSKPDLMSKSDHFMAQSMSRVKNSDTSFTILIHQTDIFVR